MTLLPLLLLALLLLLLLALTITLLPSLVLWMKLLGLLMARVLLLRLRLRLRLLLPLLLRVILRLLLTAVRSLVWYRCWSSRGCRLLLREGLLRLVLESAVGIVLKLRRAELRLLLTLRLRGRRLRVLHQLLATLLLLFPSLLLCQSAQLLRRQRR